MATYYVDSAAGGANDGTSWTDAWTSIASAVGVAAGSVILIDDGHLQQFTTSQTWTFTNGTAAAPVVILVVDKADDSLSTGAHLECTDASADDLSVNGHVFVRGLKLTTARAIFINNTSGSKTARFRQCTFTWSASNISTSTPYLWMGVDSVNGSTHVEMDGCTIDFSPGTTANNGMYVAAMTRVEMRNCTITQASTQSTLLYATYSGSIITITGSNLAALTCAPISSTIPACVTLNRCNIPSAAAWIAPTWTVPNGQAHYMVLNCANGTLTVPPLGINGTKTIGGTTKQTTSVYRTGGADDGEQANPYSLEMISGTTALETYVPLRSLPLAIWADAAGSPSSPTAKGVYASTVADPLATPAALTTDGTSTWNGSGVSTQQKISVTLSNGQTLTVYVASGGTLNNDDVGIEIVEMDQLAGVVSVAVCLYKPSTTIYVDPQIEVA